MSLIARALGGRALVAAAGALGVFVVLAWLLFSPGAAFESLAAWIAAEQRTLHRGLVASLRALKADGGLAAGWALIAGGFVYGVLHAAGPGHGKAVLSAYLLTHRDHVARGLALGAAASFAQGATAVLIVYGALALTSWFPQDTQAAVAWSERLSYAVVTALGAMLAWAAIQRLWPRLLPGSAPARSHDACGHTHGTACTQLPAPSGTRQAASPARAAGVIAAIGIRPCTGAILVLVLAHAFGLDWAGVASVAAMSAGAALAVTGIAAITVGAREWAVKLAGARAGRLAWLADAIGLFGGALIAAIGIALLAASFGPRHPLGLM